MKKKSKILIYGIFILFYLAMGIINYLNKSQWIIDNILAICFLTIIFFIARWIKVHETGFIMVGVGLLIHNLGSFGLYTKSFGIIGYDNIVHLVSSFIAAYIVFNFIARKLQVKKEEKVKYAIVNEHKFLIIILVVSFVSLLGTVIELLEFFGYSYLGSGEGILFFGAGDGIYENYVDTMTDIIVNIVGSIFGVMTYYFVHYKRKAWIRN